MSTQTESVLNRICRESIERQASEIYLLPAQVPFLRIDGETKSMTGEGIISRSFIDDLTDILLEAEEKEKLNQKREIEVVKNIGKIGNCQINLYYQKGYPACRIKLLSQEIISLEQLGLPNMVKRLTSLLKGIIFVTGPRDSGRSTLLISLLDYLNKNQKKFIATVENPIKAEIRGIKSVVEQREVGKDTKSFLQGLRYIRRRNVDVVMVSRVDNAEIMDELFALAEAGSLVLTMMDTASSLKTIQRILHFYPADKRESARYFLSENLGGIVVSRLVPKMGGGRVRALEVLPGSPSVQNVIATGRLHQLSGIIQTTEDDTSVSLEQSLADLVTSGQVVSEEAVKHAVDEEVFRSLLRRG